MGAEVNATLKCLCINYFDIGGSTCICDYSEMTFVYRFFTFAFPFVFFPCVCDATTGPSTISTSSSSSSIFFRFVPVVDPVAMASSMSTSIGSHTLDPASLLNPDCGWGWEVEPSVVAGLARRDPEPEGRDGGCIDPLERAELGEPIRGLE